MTIQTSGNQVEQWDSFEITLQGPVEGNPFLDVSVGAAFTFGHRSVTVDGFYDGNGVYRVRFMPDVVGEWTYTTISSAPEMAGAQGSFTCTEPSAGNHGPVHVCDKYHFAYADGVRYNQIGTTCYVWNHQGDALEEQTLATLREAPFNKMRMCVFPKHYTFSHNEPPTHPFEGQPEKNWDFARFNPAHFQRLEKRVGDLRDLGVEADIILFHPYDRWGYSTMDAQTDDRYLRYVIARLAAYRNVWWSMANEYDLMEAKDMADWDRFFRIVQENDPYQHLRSVHNCRGFYDHGKPWVTHCSVQHSALDRVREWREMYGKPVVVDECRYEGNIENHWGNISAHEMVHRFWLGTIGGGYVGHGETYLHPEDVLWWSKGGVLHGDSPPRIAFLRSLLDDSPPTGLEPLTSVCAHKGAEYYLYYFGLSQPGVWTMQLPDDRRYAIDLVDPWEMTVTPFEGEYSGVAVVEMPSKPYFALQVRAIED